MAEFLTAALQPQVIVALLIGFSLGAITAAGLMARADAAAERRERLAAERRAQHLQGQLTGRAWGAAANDDQPRTRRAAMRSGPR